MRKQNLKIYMQKLRVKKVPVEFANKSAWFPHPLTPKAGLSPSPN